MANITDNPCAKNSLTNLFLLWSQVDNDNAQHPIVESYESDIIFHGCLRLVFEAYCQGRTDCLSSLLDGACAKLTADCHDRVDTISSVYSLREPTTTGMILMGAVICLGVLLLLMIIGFCSATNNKRRRDSYMKTEGPVPASADNDEGDDTKEREPDEWMKGDRTKNDWAARSLAFGSIKDNLQDVAIVRETNYPYVDKTASFDDSTSNDATPSMIEPLSSTGSNADDTFCTTMCDV